MGGPVMYEPSFTDSELDEQIRNALKAAIEGDCDYYNQLVAVIYRKEHLATEEVALLVALPNWYRELKTSSRVYAAAYPDSFYGILFPDNYLHFICSSNSLHWLSTVPSGIYYEQGVSILDRSPPQVQQA